MKTISIILLNMGGPGKPDDIKPYLSNIFADPYLFDFSGKKYLAKLIVKLRVPKVKKRYKLIGGSSPLLPIMRRQAKVLQDKLNVLNFKSEDGTCKFHVFPGMRYSDPTIKDAVKKAVKLKSNLIVALSMYPHFCRSTVGSSLKELEKSLLSERFDNNASIPQVIEIDRYFDNPGYVKTVADSVKEALEKAGNNSHVIFSAHSVPVSLYKSGDPYVNEINTTKSKVDKALGLSSDFSILSFQSRVGPVKWMGPDTSRVIKTLGKKGVSSLVLVPVSFTADNLETLYDMDIVLKGIAQKSGIKNFVRAKTPDDSLIFIKFLAELVKNKIFFNK